MKNVDLSFVHHLQRGSALARGIVGSRMHVYIYVHILFFHLFDWKLKPPTSRIAVSVTREGLANVREPLSFISWNVNVEKRMKNEKKKKMLELNYRAARGGFAREVQDTMKRKKMSKKRSFQTREEIISDVECLECRKRTRWEVTVAWRAAVGVVNARVLTAWCIV